MSVIVGPIKTCTQCGLEGDKTDKDLFPRDSKGHIAGACKYCLPLMSRARQKYAYKNNPKVRAKKLADDKRRYLKQKDTVQYRNYMKMKRLEWAKEHKDKVNFCNKRWFWRNKLKTIKGYEKCLSPEDLEALATAIANKQVKGTRLQNPDKVYAWLENTVLIWKQYGRA